MTAMPPAPDAGPPGPHDDEVHELEARLADLWQRTRASARDRARAVHPQLDPTAYPLVFLLGRDGPARPSDLGARLYLDRSTVTRQVDALERLGLVRREPDPTDARARIVVLSEEARETFAALQRERAERWRAALGAWPADDVTRLADLLHRLADADIW